MTLENKIEVKDGSRLKRFLNKIKNKVAPYVLASAAAISAMPGCSGGGGGSSPPPAPVNQAPNITSTPVTTAVENQFPPYSYDVDATDPEGDNPLVYSLVTAPTGAGIVSSTGVINWTPPDQGGVGYSENFTAEATDSLGNKKQQSWVVNVTNTGTVSTTLQDFFANGLTGLDAILYDATNMFTLTNTTSSNVGFFGIPDGNYVLRVNGNSTSIHSYQEGNVAVSGNSTNLGTKKIFKISDLPITSTNVAYRDNNNNPNGLQKVKYNTGTTTGAPTPHTIINWSSFPVNVFLDASNAPTADNELADGSAGSNLVPDYVDRIRKAISLWNTAAGTTQFTEVSSSTSGSTGIDFSYISTAGPSGNTVHLSYDSVTGANKTKRIDIQTGLPMATVQGVSNHELGHTLWSRQHDGDSIYLMNTTGNASGTLHSDEVALAKIFYLMPHGEQMDRHIVP